MKTLDEAAVTSLVDAFFETTRKGGTARRAEALREVIRLAHEAGQPAPGKHLAPVVTANFKPKGASTEDVAQLRQLADLLESGECQEYCAVYVANNGYQFLGYAAPAAAVTLSTLLQRWAVDQMFSHS